MRKPILMLDKSSLQKLDKQEREPLDYRYDIRYSPILSYELLIGSEKYGQEKIDEFIGSKIKSLEHIYTDAVAGQHVCYDTAGELVKKEIIENIPITQMDYAKMGDIEDLKQAIKQESVYAKEQFDEENKLSAIWKELIENTPSNFVSEFADIIAKIGNPNINQRRFLKSIQTYLSKYGGETEYNNLARFFKDNIKNNRKSFKIELMQKFHLIEGFMETVEKHYNENPTASIKLVELIVKLTEEEEEIIEKIIANNSNEKISRKYPYTFFCYYLYFLYLSILKCGFIIKNNVTTFTRDIRYLLNLPFCDIFVSDDKDLITICKSINYTYFEKLNLKPSGLGKFHPNIMTSKEFLAQIN